MIDMARFLRESLQVTSQVYLQEKSTRKSSMTSIFVVKGWLEVGLLPSETVSCSHQEEDPKIMVRGLNTL